jgi:hypothetical protein
VDGHKACRGPEGEVRRRPAPPAVDVLAVVHEGIHFTAVGVLGAGEQRIPPQRGEVLCFIDDDGVQPLMLLHCCCQFLQQAGHLHIEILLARTVGNAQPPDVFVELTREHGLCLAPAGNTVLQVLSEALVVAEEANAFALPAEQAGLLDGEPGLPAACAAGEPDPGK